MSAATAWAIGALATTTAVSIDQQKNAQHQARLIAEENMRQAEEAIRVQEEANRVAEEAAAMQADAAEEQAQLMRDNADQAVRSAQETANQSALQRGQAIELDRQRRAAEEAARNAQKDESTKAPEVQLTTDTTETPRQRRRTFSTPTSAVRI